MSASGHAWETRDSLKISGKATSTARCRSTLPLGPRSAISWRRLKEDDTVREAGNQLELGREYPQPNEALMFQETAEIITKLMSTKRSPVPRQQHPKQHGCVRAEFTIAPDLPEKLRVGLFREPRTYPAWIRFSNSSSFTDPQGNAHGMAIKLLDVDGTKLLDAEKDARTQDFLLVDYPVFIIRTAADYLEFFRTTLKAPGRLPMSFFFPRLDPRTWRLRELRLLLAVRRLHIANPLTTQYWSMSAYQFGSQAVKYAAKPLSLPQSQPPKSAGRDYLREAMAADLRTKPAQFAFMVQFQTDARRMPIEDLTVECTSPFHQVATITIPQQTFDSDAQMAFGEQLSFTPWHCLPEHRPLGGLNRVRKVVYEASSGRRHTLNGVPRGEPTGVETLT